MNIRKIAFSITLFFSLFSVEYTAHGAYNEKRKPLLIAPSKPKRIKLQRMAEDQNHHASLLQPDEGLLAAETKAVKPDDKKEEKVELKSIEDKSATTNSIDIDSKFFETKDAIFELFPSDEVIQKDLKSLDDCFHISLALNDDIDTLNISDNIFRSLNLCRFILSVVKYLSKKVSVQVNKVSLYMKYPYSYPDYLFNTYYTCHSIDKTNLLIIGKGFLELYFFTNNLNIDRKTKIKIFIFILAHEIAHLTEENFQKPPREKEIHADKLGALICKEIFSDFDSKITLFAAKIGDQTFSRHLKDLIQKKFPKRNLNLKKAFSLTFFKLIEFLEIVYASDSVGLFFRSLHDDIFPDMHHPSRNKRAAYVAEALKNGHV